MGDECTHTRRQPCAVLGLCDRGVLESKRVEEGIPTERQKVPSTGVQEM